MKQSHAEEENHMVSIKDVAKLAGVSPSTVSLVINGSDLVKHETAYKVRQAIEQLHYVPNQAARSLVTKEKKVISLIRISNSASPKAEEDMFDFSVDTLVMDMLPGVQSVLSQHGYSLLINLFVSLDTPLDRIDVFDKAKIDGAIFVGGMITEQTQEAIRTSGIPSVLAYSRCKSTDYIDTDPEEGMYLATRYLIENGHRDIVLINGPTISQTTELKLHGYIRALEEAGLPYRPDWVRNADFIGRAAYNAMAALWDQGIRPTGVVASCDNCALGVYRFLYEQGLSCPRDISIVGYESSLLSMHCVPPMTSVCVSKREIGEEAARVLLNRIRNPKAKPVNMVLPPRLSLRDSVARIP